MVDMVLNFYNMYFTICICMTYEIILINSFSYSILSSSSLGLLPSSRSECPTTPLLPLLCFFFEFSISVFHHPVQELLSRFLPLWFALHFIPLQGIASQYMSYPVFQSCSDC